MSTFYSTIKGNRGAATRCGSRNSGIKAAVQSWDGSLISSLHYDHEGKLIVELSTSDGSSSYGSNRIFSGTLEELTNKLNKS